MGYLFGNRARLSDIVPKQGISTPSYRLNSMAKTNYSFEKRQRDLAKKKKKEEKLQRKLERKGEKPAENGEGGTEAPAGSTPAEPETGGEA